MTTPKQASTPPQEMVHFSKRPIAAYCDLDGCHYSKWLAAEARVEVVKRERDEARTKCEAMRKGADAEQWSAWGYKERMEKAEARIEALSGRLAEARQVIITACGTEAPYIKIALRRIDEALVAGANPKESET